MLRPSLAAGLAAVLVAPAGFWAAGTPEALAQSPPTQGPAASNPPTSTADNKNPPEKTPEEKAAEQRQAEREARQAELEALEKNQRESAELRAKLDQEIAAMREDRARLNAALIASADQIRTLEDRLAASERRLSTFAGTEEAIRRSLVGRRDVIVEVLAALQRMGRKPPPAVLVRPEDMLEAVRASIVLGAVLPELRAETESLASDLGELIRVKEGVAAEREHLRGEMQAMAAERTRLAALMTARQQRLAETQKSADDEQKRATELASKTRSLREFLQKIESEIASASRASEEARKAAELQGREMRDKIASLAFKDPARLSPQIAFSEARGLLPMPVSGSLVRSFGAPDGAGGTAKGISIQTRAGSVVTAPADGWVAFVGPFRSFGQLLIVNTGGGYYILMAGMERINVELGQFVLAGEPVALMGAAAAEAAAVGTDGKNPVLYVEFRRDGQSIDPTPWWVKTDNEKARG